MYKLIKISFGLLILVIVFIPIIFVVDLSPDKDELKACDNVSMCYVDDSGSE